MKFTTTLAVASLLSAAFVAATPIPYEDEVEIAVREFDDFEIEARDLDDLELEARDFDDLEARDFDDFEVDAREFDDEDLLYLRSGLGKAFRKAAKDTADIAVQKAYDVGTSGGGRVNRPSFLSGGAKKPAARPRPAGGVRPVRVPSPVKAPGKSKTNWKGAWDAAKGKAPAAKPKKSRPVLSKPAKHVARPGGHAGKPVKMPKKKGGK